MSSFANTNETKVVSTPESKTISAADEDCYEVKVQVRKMVQNGPSDDPNSYTLYYQNFTIIVCFD